VSLFSVLFNEVLTIVCVWKHDLHVIYNTLKLDLFIITLTWLFCDAIRAIEVTLASVSVIGEGKAKEKVIVAYFKVLSSHFRGGIEETTRNVS
jgi:hypothetical protein